MTMPKAGAQFKMLLFSLAFVLILFQNVILLQQKKAAQRRVEALEARLRELGATAGVAPGTEAGAASTGRVSGARSSSPPVR